MDDMDDQQVIDEKLERQRRKYAAGNLNVDFGAKPKNVQTTPDVIGVEAATAWLKSRKARRE